MSVITDISDITIGDTLTAQYDGYRVDLRIVHFYYEGDTSNEMSLVVKSPFVTRWGVIQIGTELEGKLNIPGFNGNPSPLGQGPSLSEKPVVITLEINGEEIDLTDIVYHEGGFPRYLNWEPLTLDVQPTPTTTFHIIYDVPKDNLYHQVDFYGRIISFDLATNVFTVVSPDGTNHSLGFYVDNNKPIPIIDNIPMDLNYFGRVEYTN